MAIWFDLAPDQFHPAILEPRIGLRERSVSGAQALDFAAFKRNSGLHPFQQLVFERRPLVGDSSPSLGWNSLCHATKMLSGEPIAATGFRGITYNQVAV